MPKALIIGVTSQDGSYMADLLLEKGYEVVGTIRRSTTFKHENIAHLYGRITFDLVDLVDGSSVDRVVRVHKPDEIYNFASQSVPADSWPLPVHTGEVTALGPLRVLEAARQYVPHARVYQATSREIFGNIDAESANESTPIDANNPYGIAKAYAHMMARCYREAYGMFACAGILFNHESPRRSLVVGSMGRLVKQKRARDLIEAAPEILHRFPNARFVVAGDGPLANQLAEDAENRGVDESFIFTGTVHDAENLYPALDVFAQLADREGFGLTLVEAMASGTAVVAAKSAPIPEIVEHGRNGMMFEIGDVRALESHVSTLFENPDMRTRLGSAAEQDVQRFNMPDIAKRYGSLYRELLERQAEPGP